MSSNPETAAITGTSLCQTKTTGGVKGPRDGGGNFAVTLSTNRGSCKTPTVSLQHNIPADTAARSVTILQQTCRSDVSLSSKKRVNWWWEKPAAVPRRPPGRLPRVTRCPAASGRWSTDPSAPLSHGNGDMEGNGVFCLSQRTEDTESH